jgi:quercetin dioxygenase-like cupin family protein
MSVERIPRPGWDPLPHEGDIGVVGRVLLRAADLGIAELRFSEHATIHEHPGEDDAIVICLAGEGFTSIGGETVPLREEEWVLWPKGTPHRLWTEGSTMTTLMIEQADWRT